MDDCEEWLRVTFNKGDHRVVNCIVDALWETFEHATEDAHSASLAHSAPCEDSSEPPKPRMPTVGQAYTMAATATTATKVQVDRTYNPSHDNSVLELRKLIVCAQTCAVLCCAGVDRFEALRVLLGHPSQLPVECSESIKPLFA